MADRTAYLIDLEDIEDLSDAERIYYFTQVAIDMNTVPRPGYYFTTDGDLHPVVARFAEQHA